jgi:disulfide bond formation protein DsbB
MASQLHDRSEQTSRKSGSPPQASTHDGDRYASVRLPAQSMLSAREIRCVGVALLVVVVAVLGVSAIVGVSVAVASIFPKAEAPLDPTEAARQKRIAELNRFGPPGPTLDGLAFVRGRDVFMSSCVACHGVDARGVKGLGKDLIASAFLRKQSDTALAHFIKVGRAADDPANTTKIPMPPNGGNDTLTDADRADLVVFLRGMRDPRRVPTMLPELPEDPPALASTPQPVVAETSEVASGGTPVSTGSAPTSFDPAVLARGKKVFTSCIACHAKDGTGVKGAGKDLVHSEFVARSSDAELVAFVKRGRDTADPANTTGIAMPPKGGNPALNDAKIADAVVYLRSLQQQASVSK